MSAPQILTPEELAEAIAKRSDWVLKDGKIGAKFEFKDFKNAMAFITIVALEAEKHNHHPTWTNSWNIVEFSFCTHDAGNKITELDFLLADLISQAALQIGGGSIDDD